MIIYMKVAFVVFVIGEKYINDFNKYFKIPMQEYCKKYNYDLIIQTSLLINETNLEKKKFYWQRIVIPYFFKDYDYVISIDSDIYINKNSPPLPLNDIPEGKVAAVNERKYMGNYEWRENIQQREGWEVTGKEWHAKSGENRNYNDHINGGFIIYQPKFHGDVMKKLYDENINNYTKYHQDDQSILSLYFIDNDMIYWLDERYNKIWFFWKNIFYPGFDSYAENMKKAFVHNFLNLNYFTHFTSGIDKQYI